jgi:hypothetical protein
MAAAGRSQLRLPTLAASATSNASSLRGKTSSFFLNNPRVHSEHPCCCMIFVFGKFLVDSTTEDLTLQAFSRLRITNSV